jgi:ribonuclease P protein component
VTAVVRRDGVASPRPQLWRVSDRSSLQALQATPSVRRGPLSVRYLPPTDPSTPPRAAFAVGKAAGGAVVRNRIRRRLRAALRQLQAEGTLPGGAYLLGGRAELARRPWSALVSDLDAAVRAATGAGR